MDTLQLVAATFYGTAAMTVFSYVLSLAVHSNFREPEILAILSCRLFQGERRWLHAIIGWVLHVIAGLAFVLAYMLMWNQSVVAPTLVNSVWIGAVSGVVAIGIWFTVFRLHPDPPQINYKGYYANLFFAHIIFCMFATIGYNIGGFM